MIMKDSIIVLSGGVGGARFLEGLIQVVPQKNVVVIGNTGDDEMFYGLHVSPDLDSVMYTLSGVNDEKQGWGLQNETYNTMKQLAKLGNEQWFTLGDKDLATHIHRTQLLHQGKKLSEITEKLMRKFGLEITLLPMTNDFMRTYIQTPHACIPFQEYFVKNRWQDEIVDIIYCDSQKTKPTPGILESIQNAKAVIIAPSNPLVSIDTILAIPGIKNALVQTKAKIAAVSPIVSGTAIKGPAAKMMKAMGMEVSAVGVAEHYRDFLDVMIIDTQDKHLKSNIEKLGIKAIETNTIMKDKKTKAHLAQTVLDALQS
jgi:LPPG:FO 2-phospho-L-lactate transferase